MHRAGVELRARARTEFFGFEVAGDGRRHPAAVIGACRRHGAAVKI